MKRTHVIMFPKLTYSVVLKVAGILPKFRLSSQYYGRLSTNSPTIPTCAIMCSSISRGCDHAMPPIVDMLLSLGACTPVIGYLHRTGQRSAWDTDSSANAVWSTMSEAAASHTSTIPLFCIYAISVARHSSSGPCGRVYTIAFRSKSCTAGVHSWNPAINV